MEAANVAGYNVVTPRYDLNPIVRTQTTAVKPRLYWLPFNEASVVDGFAFKKVGDCTHPKADPFLWTIVWDGLTRHLVSTFPEKYKDNS